MKVFNSLALKWSDEKFNRYMPVLLTPLESTKHCEFSYVKTGFYLLKINELYLIKKHTTLNWHILPHGGYIYWQFLNVFADSDKK